MKRIALLVAWLGAVVAAPVHATTLTVNGITSSDYSAFVQIGQTRYNVPDSNFVVFETDEGKQAVGITLYSVQDALGKVEIRSGIMNPDPFITWSIAATNGTSTSVGFLFGFTTPLSPTVTSPATARSQISGGMTDNSGDGLTLTPLAGSFLQQVFLNGSTSAAVDSGPAAGITGNGSPQTAGYSLPGPLPYSAGPLLTPAGTFSTLTTQIGFNLSGLSDNVALSGNALLTPVPIPAAAWLLMSGIAGLAGLVRRSRS
jgi:hypothetical protein